MENALCNHIGKTLCSHVEKALFIHMGKVLSYQQISIWPQPDPMWKKHCVVIWKKHHVITWIKRHFTKNNQSVVTALSRMKTGLCNHKSTIYHKKLWLAWTEPCRKWKESYPVSKKAQSNDMGKTPSSHLYVCMYICICLCKHIDIHCRTARTKNLFT